MGLAVAPSTLIHSFLTVGTILHPSRICTYGLHMAVYAGVSGSVRLTPQTGRTRGGAETLQQTNTQKPLKSPRLCLCSCRCNSPCRTSANMFDRGNAATNKRDILVQQDSGIEKIDKRKESCRRRRVHAGQRASNLRPPGRSTRALPIYYATDVFKYPLSDPPSHTAFSTWLVERA